MAMGQLQEEQILFTRRTMRSFCFINSIDLHLFRVKLAMKDLYISVSNYINMQVCTSTCKLIYVPPHASLYLYMQAHAANELI